MTATHIDFQGHHAFAEGTTLDLTRTTDLGDDGYWRLQHWKQQAKSWSAELVMLDLIRESTKPTTPERRAQEIALFTPHSTCGECGERVHYALDGGAFVAQSRCAAAGGMKPYTVDIAVPSGTLVFANDLRALTIVEEGYDVNLAIGRKHTTEDYAAQGMLHVYVGNTCPSVYQDGDGLVVDNRDEDDESAHGTDTSCGTICTDLWWASAMDEDLFLERCTLMGQHPESFDVFRVHVPQGTYEATVLLPDRDAPGTIRHFALRRVDRPAPVLTFVGPRTADEVEDSSLAYEVARTMARAYLGTHTRVQALELVAFLSGHGYRWHGGHLRDLNGHPEDAPATPDLALGAKLRAAIQVPDIPYGEHRASLVDNLRFTPIGQVPANVDPWWLAGCILTAQAALRAHTAWGDTPPANLSTQQAQRWTPEAMAKARAQLDGLLTHLFAIAAEQDMATNGTLVGYLENVHAFLTRNAA